MVGKHPMIDRMQPVNSLIAPKGGMQYSSEVALKLIFKLYK